MHVAPGSEVLTLLGRIEAKLDHVAVEIGDARDRLGRLVDGLRLIDRPMERIDARFARIERRLVVVDVPH